MSVSSWCLAALSLLCRLSTRCVQSTAVLNRVSEVDSDMADITQDAPGEIMLGEEEGESCMGEKGSRVGNVTPTEHDSVSASSQIASSLGINPHTLQVTCSTCLMVWVGGVFSLTHFMTVACVSLFSDYEGIPVC